MAQVFPTKSNLMAQKRSLALASQGYDLMDRKRNILVREMMQLIDRAAVIQDEIATAYSSAYKALQRANITLGVVGEFAKTVPVETGLKLDYRSVMGVELPIVEMEESAPGLSYGLDSTNSQLDDVYLKFCEVKRLTVELAEVESSVYRLAVAIQKTQKRANALNNIMIPQFTATIKYITEVLEEKEREDFSRLKVIKAQKEKEEEGPPMDLRINMLINATPNATMKIVMDPVAGDNITATGNGNLQVNYFNKGDFKMFGNYIIDQGMYKLSMQEVIRKDFTLKSGGTVTFTGDPYQANLDLQAIYTVNSASLSDLGIDTSLSQGQSTVKVNCLMNLTGNLSSPDIKFDLDLPTVREEDRDVVRSITSTEEQMNTQIIYLLGIGKFYTYDYANNDQSSNATSSLAFSTLSGQLNNMLSQWMDNKNWNIGANLSTGDKGWTDVEAEAVLSGRLLNNRLIINGNFGYKDNAMANTNFVGDFEAIWLLTKNGDFRLRGYNQTNDRYFTKSTLTTQGIGIMYKKDFDKWNDLFRWFLWKRAHKKKEKEDTTSSSPASQTKRNDN